MCSDASTQTYSQHNAALLKSSPHNLHKLSPVFARISSNNVEILLYPLLTGPLWNCAPQPYWLIVVAVSTWSFPLRFLQNPAPGHFARLFWFCVSCHQCQCKKNCCQCHPWQLLPNDRPSYLCGWEDRLCYAEDKGINHHHGLRIDSQLLPFTPSGISWMASSAIRIVILHQGRHPSTRTKIFSWDWKPVSLQAPFFADMICEHWTAAPTVEHEL